MTEKTVRLRPEDRHWREVEGEVTILDVRASGYFAVNRSGAALWAAIAAGASGRQLAELVERFGWARRPLRRTPATSWPSWSGAGS